MWTKNYLHDKGSVFKSLSPGTQWPTAFHANFVHPLLACDTLHLALYAGGVLVFMEEPLQSITNLLPICEEYSCLSGFNVNWTKSTLLILNDSAKGLQFLSGIPVVHNFSYLGIQHFPSLNRTVINNYR